MAWVGARLSAARGESCCSNSRPCPITTSFRVQTAGCRRLVPTDPGARLHSCPRGWGPSGASSSQSKTRRLCLKWAHLVPCLAVQITSFVTLAKPLLLSEPPLPPLRGANNSSLSGCCNDSERDGCEQSGRTEVCHRARYCKYPSNHCWPTNRHREDVPGSS